MDYIPTSILIVHPKSFAAELLTRVLSRVSHYSVLSLVTSCEELHEVLRNSRVDVMLISHKMLQTSPDGLAAIKSLRSEFPSLKTVLLLEDRTPSIVIESFRSGAKGVFCIASGEFYSLCRCVDHVHAGEIWASNEEMKWVLEAFESSGAYRCRANIVNSNGASSLSEREQDVVELTLEGLSNREIAYQLKLSEYTIKNYLFRIFEKVGVYKRTELPLYAMKNAKKPVARLMPSLQLAPILTLPRRDFANGPSARTPRGILAQQSWF
jgi:DNA-binding NarL/FixJ family response regulator